MRIEDLGVCVRMYSKDSCALIGQLTSGGYYAHWSPAATLLIVRVCVESECVVFFVLKRNKKCENQATIRNERKISIFFKRL